MYAMRNLPSKRCLRLVWGVGHSLPSDRLAPAGAPTAALPAARLGSCESRGWHLLKVTPGTAGSRRQPELPSDSGVAAWGGFWPREVRAGRGGFRRPRGAPGLAQAGRGSPLSRPPGWSHGCSRRRAGRSRTADMELRVALGLALLCSALEAAPAGPQRPRSAVGESAGGQRLRGPAGAARGGRGRRVRGGPAREARPGAAASPVAGSGARAARSPLAAPSPPPGTAPCTEPAAVAFPVPTDFGHTWLLNQSTGHFWGSGGYTGFIFSCPGRPAGEVRWALPCLWHGVPRHALQTPRLGAVLGSAGSKHTRSAWPDPCSGRACRWVLRNSFPQNSNSVLLTLASELARSSVPAFVLSPADRHHNCRDFEDHLWSFIPEIKLHGIQSCGAY